MSETRLTLSPIDLSSIPDLGLTEQEQLMHEADACINGKTFAWPLGVCLGFASIYLACVGLMAVDKHLGIFSFIGSVFSVVIAALSASGTAVAISMCAVGTSMARKFEDACIKLLTCSDAQPLAPYEHRLRISAVAWNEALAAWQEARDATTLEDPRSHREEIFRQAERLLVDKRRLLDAIERLKPYHKLLTPAG